MRMGDLAVFLEQFEVVKLSEAHQPTVELMLNYDINSVSELVFELISLS